MSYFGGRQEKFLMNCRKFSRYGRHKIHSFVGAILFFAVGNLIMGEKEAALGLLLIGFFISPFGLPALALWMVEKLDDLKEMIREL